MKEKARGKGEMREDNLQGDSSFNDLQYLLLLDSSLADVAKKQMTALGVLRVHILYSFLGRGKCE